MVEILYDYIEQKSGMTLSTDEKVLIENNFSLKRLRKKQYLQQEGDICRQMAFVKKGAACMYSVDDKGREHIIRFAVEGWWVGDYESYMLEQPTRYHVEMMEDSELLTIRKENMQQLIATIPAVAEMIKVIDKQSNIASQQRIHSAISLSAEERFESLNRTYPDFLQRFPLNMIASYLGITPETLSRIRKKMIQR